MTSSVEDDEPEVAAKPDSHLGYDIGRLLAFSDGVFAIAITLLVLSVPVPNITSTDPSVQSAQLARALLDLRPSLYGFALSFILVGAQWILHHRMLRQLDFCDGRVLWLNLLILLGICLVPFATTLLTRYGDTPTGAIAYAAWQSLIGLAFMVMRLYLAARGAAPRWSVLVGVAQISGFVLSIPVALRSVEWAYVIWIAGFAAARTMEARARVIPR